MEVNILNLIFWLFFGYFLNLTAKVGEDSSVSDTFIICGRGFLHSGNGAKISKASRNYLRSN